MLHGPRRMFGKLGSGLRQTGHRQQPDGILLVVPQLRHLDGAKIALGPARHGQTPPQMLRGGPADHGRFVGAEFFVERQEFVLLRGRFGIGAFDEVKDGRHDAGATDLGGEPVGAREAFDEAHPEGHRLGVFGGGGSFADFSQDDNGLIAHHGFFDGGEAFQEGQKFRDFGGIGQHLRDGGQLLSQNEQQFVRNGDRGLFGLSRGGGWWRCGLQRQLRQVRK